MAKDLRSSDVKDLEAPTSANATDLIPVERNGRDVQLTAQMIANLGGGGGAVSSVDGRTGAVTLSDLYDASGAAATAQANAEAASQPLDADLTAIAALVTQAYGRGLLTALNATAAQAYLAPGDFIVPLPHDGTNRNLAVGDPVNDTVFSSFDANHQAAGGGTGGMGLFAATDGFTASADLSADAVVVVPDGSQLYGRFVAQVTPFGAAPRLWELLADETKAWLRIELATSQTAPAVVIQDVSATVFARIMPSGAVISNAHAAPADADLNNSDHATWLDDTPGATVLHIKAKDSGGTVRTASIPLG